MSVPTFAEIARVPEVVPMLGDTLSQAEEFESVPAVKLSAPPPPLLVTFTIAGAGFAQKLIDSGGPLEAWIKLKIELGCIAQS